MSMLGELTGSRRESIRPSYCGLPFSGSRTGFSEIEDLAHPGSFGDQKHRMGPVVYLKLGEHEEKQALAAHHAEAHGPEKPE